MKRLYLFLFLFPPVTLIAQLRTTIVIPYDTDPQINTFTTGNKMHVVYYDSSAPKKNQLYIFLPGTNGTGFGGGQINKLAAALGYHVISLQYPDTIALAIYRNVNDAEAYSRGREEIITGKNLSEEYEVDRANSIENRIIKLLSWLAAKFPKENWQQFLDKKNELVWEKIVIAGHSQGGGHAAFIAKKHLVARVIMFGAPKDFSFYFNAPAEWLSWKTVTPVNRYFTFVHTLDEQACSFPQQTEIWRSLGMYKGSQLVNVDSIAFPFDHSRILTSIKPQPNPHGAVIADASYSNAWKFMMTEN